MNSRSLERPGLIIETSEYALNRLNWILDAVPWNHFLSFISMEKPIKKFCIAGFFLAAINATVFRNWVAQLQVSKYNYMYQYKLI